MPIYTCEKCARTFERKSGFDSHKAKKKDCSTTTALALLHPTTNVVHMIPAATALAAPNYAKQTLPELIASCKAAGLKGYSGKKKEDVLRLLMPSASPAPVAAPEKAGETNLDLLNECLKTRGLSQVAEALNLCVGTVRRWQELNDVPVQYTFDLYKLLSREIDYSTFSSSSKDQFFTPSLVSKRCWDTFRELVDIDLADYIFVEPSAGDGSFLKRLPPGSIGLDIEPRGEGIVKQDYLTWTPTDLTKKYIVVGNPPFGLRGHLALNFINHSYKFADYVCFILPQLFESDGKGSPRKRVVGYNLIHSEPLSAMFYSPDNQEVKINGVFQIWSKYTKNPKYDLLKPSEDAMKVYSLSDGGTVASTRNKEMIGKCDVYLPSTCFGKERMKLYASFDDLPGKKGYGIVFFKNKDAMIAKANAVDWSSVAFLSTNSAYNLRTSLVFDGLLRESSTL